MEVNVKRMKRPIYSTLLFHYSANMGFKGTLVRVSSGYEMTSVRVGLGMS